MIMLCNVTFCTMICMAVQEERNFARTVHLLLISLLLQLSTTPCRATLDHSLCALTLLVSPVAFPEASERDCASSSYILGSGRASGFCPMVSVALSGFLLMLGSGILEVCNG